MRYLFTYSDVFKDACFQQIQGGLAELFTTYHPNTNIPTYLRMRRHSDILLRRNRILRAPKARNSLPLRVEAQSIFPVEIARPCPRHTLLVAREAEHGQRDGDGDVDPQLAGFDLLLEAGGGGAGFGEDGGAVAVFVGVDQVDGFVGCFDVEAHEDGAEDLFRVAFHVGFYVGDYGWGDLGGLLVLVLLLCDGKKDDSYPVAVWILLRLVATTIQQDIRTLINGALDQRFNTLLALRAD